MKIKRLANAKRSSSPSLDNKPWTASCADHAERGKAGNCRIRRPQMRGFYMKKHLTGFKHLC
jgi:hypothetical protein